MSESPAGDARRHGLAERAATSVALIERLNHGWRVAGPESRATAKHRLVYAVRRVLAALLRPQETFNSTVVQYINTMAPFTEDEMRRHQETLAARERRLDAELAAIRAENQELRASLGVLQSLARRPTFAARTPEHDTATPVAPASAADPNASLSFRYVGFEDQFRGSPDAIRERLASYLGIFAGASDVLDVGCGRGEFIALLREQGISAHGLDLNDAMVDVCRAQGFSVANTDAVSYLRAQPDASLGGLFAAQVVEHLEPGYLTQLLDVAFDKLRPGAPIVLETINPACWFAFFESYIRDITHVRPLHPDTLKFLLIAAGFQQLEIQYRVPYPEHEKLQAIPAAPALIDSLETLNANVEKINRLLFTHLDYAAVGRRP